MARGRGTPLARVARSTRVFTLGPDGWLIRNDGFCRTLTLPWTGKVPDLTRSRGLAGWRRLRRATMGPGGTCTVTARATAHRRESPTGDEQADDIPLSHRWQTRAGPAAGLWQAKKIPAPHI